MRRPGRGAASVVRTGCVLFGDPYRLGAAPGGVVVHPGDRLVAADVNGVGAALGETGNGLAQAAVALEDLVRKLRCRYILFSYNNNGKKLQCRSNAKLTDEEIVRILSIRGDVQVFTMNYRGFEAGYEAKNKDNQERLFLCSVHR